MNSILRIGKALIWKQFRESLWLVIPLIISLCILLFLVRTTIGGYDSPAKSFLYYFFLGIIVLMYSWFISCESERKTFKFLFSHPLRPILYLSLSYTFSFVILLFIYHILSAYLYFFIPGFNYYFYPIDLPHIFVIYLSLGACLIFISVLSPNRTLNICINSLISYWLFLFLSFNRFTPSDSVNIFLIDLNTFMTYSTVPFFIFITVFFFVLAFYALRLRICFSRNTFILCAASLLLFIFLQHFISITLTRNYNITKTDQKDIHSYHYQDNYSMSNSVNFVGGQSDESDNYSIYIYGIQDKVTANMIYGVTDSQPSNRIADPTYFVDIKRYDTDEKPSMILHQPLSEILNTYDAPGRLARALFSFTDNAVLVSYLAIDPTTENPDTNMNDVNVNKYILASKVNLTDPTSSSRISKLEFTYRDAKINKTFLVNTVYPGIFLTKDLQKLQDDIYNFYRSEYQSLIPKGEDVTLRNFSLYFLPMSIFQYSYHKSHKGNGNTSYFMGTNFMALQKSTSNRTKIKPNTIGIIKENISSNDTLNITYFADIPSPIDLQDDYFLGDYTVDGNNLIHFHSSSGSDSIAIYDISNPEKITVKAVLRHPLYRKILNWKVLPDHFMNDFKVQGYSIDNSIQCKNNILFTQYKNTFCVYDISDFKSIKPIARYTDPSNTYQSSLTFTPIDNNNFYVQPRRGNSPSIRMNFNIKNFQSQ